MAVATSDLAVLDLQVSCQPRSHMGDSSLDSREQKQTANGRDVFFSCFFSPPRFLEKDVVSTERGVGGFPQDRIRPSEETHNFDEVLCGRRTLLVNDSLSRKNERWKLVSSFSREVIVRMSLCVSDGGNMRDVCVGGEHKQIPTRRKQ